MVLTLPELPTVTICHDLTFKFEIADMMAKMTNNKSKRISAKGNISHVIVTGLCQMDIHSLLRIIALHLCQGIALNWEEWFNISLENVSRFRNDAFLIPWISLYNYCNFSQPKDQFSLYLPSYIRNYPYF